MSSTRTDDPARTDDPVVVAAAGRGRWRALVGLVRPRQWVKNVLVLAAPGAAGVLTEANMAARTLVAFVALSLAASGTYALNDAADAEADRLHPVKRLRAVASGRVTVGTARLLGAVLLTAGIGFGFLSGTWQLPVVVACYVALTTAYSLVLKHVPVFDIAAVAAGFVLRGLAGAAATGVPVSDWFLIVASFGSLLMVVGKRETELRLIGEGATRPILARYPEPFLRTVRTLAATGVLLSYALFAFERAGEATAALPWFELSFVPFTLAILVYLLRIEEGLAAEPTEVVLRDRSLQAIGLVWAVVFALGVHLA